MSRIRTIQPNFPKSRSMGRVSRDARLLFIQLWLVADDAGRLRFDHEALLEELYPEDSDASTFLTSWLSELEREKCIERYQVNDLAFVRIVKWRKHQTVDRPSPSFYPAAPREAREARDAREESPRRLVPPASGPIPREKRNWTPETLIEAAETIYDDTLERGSATQKIQAVKLIGQTTGLLGTKRERPRPKSPPLSEIVR
jgi:hypothetical protein